MRILRLIVVVSGVLAVAAFRQAAGSANSGLTPSPESTAESARPVAAPPSTTNRALPTSTLDSVGDARRHLGRSLFYDRRLSGDGTIACATCHRPEYAFSDRRPVSAGIEGRKGHRKAPALINQATAIYPYFFRDGRATSLEEQALEPIINPVEMGNTHDAMLSTLEAIPGYRRPFTEAFGSAEITKQRVAQALADYVRSLVSGDSAWDRWRRARDESAVTEEAKRGHDLFFGKAGCNQCHLGSDFTDSSFHNLGIGWVATTQKFLDEGRYAVTQRKTDMGAFKTPTLREVTKHAPYMHDGSIATLREVIEWYNRGGEKNPYLDPRIQPLNLSDAEVEALVAFLHSLEGEGYQDVAPTRFPE